jgi:hypothetical protein
MYARSPGALRVDRRLGPILFANRTVGDERVGGTSRRVERVIRMQMDTPGSIERAPEIQPGKRFAL